MVGLYGARAVANPAISSFYISGQIAADSGFTTGVQNVSINNNSPVAFVPLGDYFQFGVSTVIVGNTNTTAGDPWDVANQANGNPAQPANLGMAQVAYQVLSTSNNSNGSLLQPMPSGGFVNGQTSYSSTAVLANVLPDALEGSGDVQSNDGYVGLNNPIFQGTFPQGASSLTAAGIAEMTSWEGASATPAAATPMFTNLSYQAVNSGIVGLEPVIFPSATLFFIPKNAGTVGNNGNTTSNPATYTDLVSNNSSGDAASLPMAPVLGVYIAPAITWDGQADHTSWNTSTANWNNGGNTSSTFSGNDLVTFDDSAPSNATSIALNTTVSPYLVTVNSSARNYSITGSGAISAISLVKQGSSTLTIATNNTISSSTTISGGTLQVGSGGSSGSIGSAPITDNAALVFDLSSSPTISNAISGTGSLAQSGTGTLGLSGANSYTGATTANSGTLLVNAAGALPAGTALAVNGTSVVKLAAGTGGETLSSLSVASGAKLDITNNHIVVADPGGIHDDSTFTSILASVKSGAITSTAGLTDYGVGLVDGNDGISGSKVSANTIEVAYTLDGDANLDGKVDAVDFGIFAPNFGVTNFTLGWEGGDFNYDGKVDATDFGLFATNFGQQDSGTDISLPSADVAALNAFASANGLVIDVPEPVSASLLALGGMIILQRRTRRKST